MQVLDTIGFSVLSSLHPHEMDGIEVEAKNMNGATDEHLSGALCYSLVVGSSSILHAHRMLWMEKKKKLVEAMGSWNSKSSQAPSSSQSDEEERHVLLQTRYTEKEQLCIVDVLNPRLSKCPNAP